MWRAVRSGLVQHPVWVLALLLAIFALRLAASATAHSLTADEPHYMGTGVHLWKSGDYHFARTLRFQPPLAYHLASLPLLGVDLEGVGGSDDVGEQLVVRGRLSPAGLRILSRLPFALLACWGATLLFLWGREAAGPAAGLWAAALYTFSPMLLAHGSIAHSDIVVSVLYTQVLYTFWRWYRKPGALRLLLCAVSLGLALLAKYSALLLLPTLALLLLGAWPRAREKDAELAIGPDPPGRRALWLCGVGAGLAVGAIATLWVGYGGSFASVAEPGSRFPQVALPAWLQPFFFYLEIHGEGRRVFFLGEFAQEWYGFHFFPIAYALKTPLGMLALLGLAFASLRHTPLALGRFLAVPTLVFLAVLFFWVNVPTGLRYMLPLYPLLALFVGTQLGRVAWGDHRWEQGIAVAALAWTALAGLVAHPHYLAYFNEAAGGSRAGHHYLLDANLDWGQELPALAEALRERGDPVVRYAVFGPERPEVYGIRAQPLSDCLPVGGWLAISPNVREGLYAWPNVFAQPEPGCWDWLREHEPVARPGGVLFLYDLPMTAVP